MGEGGQPQGGIGKIQGIPGHGAGDLADIPGAGVLPLGGQARAVDVMGVLQPHFRGPMIHFVHEGLLAARCVLGQGHGAVVAAGDDGAAQQILHGIHGTRVQQGGGADGGGRVAGNRHRILEPQPPLIDFLQQEQQRHQLGHGSRLPPLIGVLFKDHSTGSCLHQQIGRGGQGDGRFAFQRRGGGRHGGQTDKDPRQQKGGDATELFHTVSLLHLQEIVCALVRNYPRMRLISSSTMALVT